MKIYKDIVSENDLARLETIGKISIYFDYLNNTIRCTIYDFNSSNFIDCLWTHFNRSVISDFLSNDTLFDDRRKL